MRLCILFIIFFLSHMLFTIEGKTQNNKIDSLTIRINQLLHDTDKVNTINALTREFIIIGDYENGLKQINNVTQISEKILAGSNELKIQLTIKKGLATAKNHAGLMCWYQGNYDEALKNYLKSLTLREEVKTHAPGDVKNKQGIAVVCNNIGNIHADQSDYLKALKNYIKALKLKEDIFYSLSDKEERYELQKSIGNSYNNIGALYGEQGDRQESLKYYETALKIRRKIGDDQGMAGSYNNIGSVFREKGDLEKDTAQSAILYQKALDYYFQALKLREEQGDRKGMADCLGNVGLVFQTKKNYPKALNYLYASLKLKTEITDKNGIINACLNIGRINLLVKNYEEAKKYYNLALPLSKETGYKRAELDIYKGLSDLHDLTGSWKEAYQYHQLFSQSKDSIISEEKNKQIAEMQTKYETEKKQKENEILSQENEIKTLEINQQKNQRTVLIGVFGFILLTGLLIFNRQRLKQKNKILIEKELRASAVFQAQEKEKVHLSKELHDGLGPLLSLIKLNVSSLETNSGNQKMISEIKELASEGMKEVRTISHALMPSLLEKNGLEAVLKEFAEQINQTQILKTELIFSISTRFSKETEINIYRIVQEAVNNILKHAEANLAIIRLEEKDKQLELIISDNGKGFDVTKTTTGNGLNNIYSRIDFLKGKIQIKSNNTEGTVFTIFIPVKALQYA